MENVTETFSCGEIVGETVRMCVKARMPIQNIEALQTAVEECWAEIPEKTLRGLIQSMPELIHEVIKSKGGATSFWGQRMERTSLRGRENEREHLNFPKFCTTWIQVWSVFWPHAQSWWASTRPWVEDVFSDGSSKYLFILSWFEGMVHFWKNFPYFCTILYSLQSSTTCLWTRLPVH